MNKTISNSDWQQEILLAANQELLTNYQRQPSACTALLISRNYRLLLTHADRADIKTRWQYLSKCWWELYCRLRQLPIFSMNDFSSL